MRFRYCFFILFIVVINSVQAQDTISATLKPSSPGAIIPADFAGLSFEAGDLNTELFTPSKDTLITLFHTLNLKSLRIGGNSVDKDTFSVTEGKNRFTETEIDSFYSFIGKTSCKVIMGLNLGGYNNPSLAASEASYILKNYATDLYGFEVGNEADLYHSNGYRPSWYNVLSYDSEYTAYYDSIRHYYPKATFTGPASASDYSTFTMPFCRKMKGKFSLLTQHYYVAAANSAPVHKQVVTLLSQAKQTSLLTEVKALVACADSNPVPFRMSECNSFYNGGQWGVSDAFASSIWALDYMYALAEAGCAGINFHGGLGGPYTPISRTKNIYSARPIFYGMLAFQVGNVGKFIPNTITNNKINLNLYSTIDTLSDDVYITVVNKDTLQNALVKINAGTAKYTVADYITLSSDSLTDTTMVTLGGQQVAANGTCAPYTWNPLKVISNTTQLLVPFGSAAIIRFSVNPTSINNLNPADSWFSLYPNPALSSIVLHCNTVLSGYNKVLIYDVSGKKIVEASLTQQYSTIDISQLSTGLYFITVMQGSDILYRSKFIKE